MGRRRLHESTRIVQCNIISGLVLWAAEGPHREGMQARGQQHDTAAKARPLSSRLWYCDGKPTPPAPASLARRTSLTCGCSTTRSAAWPCCRCGRPLHARQHACMHNCNCVRRRCPAALPRCQILLLPCYPVAVVLPHRVYTDSSQYLAACSACRPLHAGRPARAAPPGQQGMPCSGPLRLRAALVCGSPEGVDQRRIVQGTARPRRFNPGCSFTYSVQVYVSCDCTHPSPPPRAHPTRPSGALHPGRGGRQPARQQPQARRDRARPGRKGVRPHGAAQRKGAQA